MYSMISAHDASDSAIDASGVNQTELVTNKVS